MQPTWGLLLPKGWIGLVAVAMTMYGTVASLQITDTITVGSIVVASLVIIAGGIFSLRNNVRSFWRTLATERGEQIKVLEEHLAEKNKMIIEMQETAKDELRQTSDEQRVIRHELKNQIAALTHTLQVEQAKTDLSMLMEQLAQQHTEAMASIASGLHKQEEIISLLAGRETA